MTNRVDNALNEIFDIELTQTDKSASELAIIAQQKDIDSLEKQREYVKNNIVGLIEKGKSALENLASIAASTEKGRDYEVLLTGLKTLVEMNKDLLDVEVVHKKPQDLPQAGQTASTINNQQNVFVGSTAELQEFLSNQQK